MHKAYRIVGSSETYPTNLPKGFEVREREVGEVLGTQEIVFREVKDGSVVMYRQGVANSSAKILPDELEEVWRFLLKVWQEHN